MGSSSYRREDYESLGESKTRRKPEKSQMEIIIDRMKSVEQSRKALEKAREGLEDAENQFMDAEKELKESERAVMEQIDRLDPETKKMLKGMLSKLNKGSRNDDRDDR